MDQRPVLRAARVAVITSAASGIGLAAAKRFAGFGMRVCLADLGGDALDHAVSEVVDIAKDGASDVLAVPTDVSRLDEVQRLKDRVFAAFGEVAVLNVYEIKSSLILQPGPAALTDGLAKLQKIVWQWAGMT